MNSRTKIKVDRLKLIEAIKERQREQQAEYETALEKYEKECEEHPVLVGEALEELGHSICEGSIEVDEVCTWQGDVRRKFLPDPPKKPQKPKDMTLAIKQLELASDDTIQISGEDFAAYMK